MFSITVEKILRLTCVVTILSACLAGLAITARRGIPALAQRTEDSKKKKPRAENNYLFTEQTPGGTWLFEAADFDFEQTHDPSLPVVIAAIRSYVGRGNWRKHLMIESIVLKNRTTKTIRDFRLGWIIITAEDEEAGKN